MIKKTKIKNKENFKPPTAQTRKVKDNQSIHYNEYLQLTTKSANIVHFASRQVLLWNVEFFILFFSWTLDDNFLLIYGLFYIRKKIPSTNEHFILSLLWGACIRLLINIGNSKRHDRIRHQLIMNKGKFQHIYCHTIFFLV